MLDIILSKYWFFISHTFILIRQRGFKWLSRFSVIFIVIGNFMRIQIQLSFYYLITEILFARNLIKWSNNVTHLHLSRQLICRGICKIVIWLNHQFLWASNMYFSWFKSLNGSVMPCSRRGSGVLLEQRSTDWAGFYISLPSLFCYLQ